MRQVPACYGIGQTGSFVRHITDHFGLTPYFREIGGASFDASRRTKSAVIAEVLNRLGLQRQRNASSWWGIRPMMLKVPAR